MSRIAQLGSSDRIGTVVADPATTVLAELPRDAHRGIESGSDARCHARTVEGRDAALRGAVGRRADRPAAGAGTSRGRRLLGEAA